MALGGPQLFPSLKAGSVDASVLGSPDNFRAAEGGFNQLLFLGDDVRSLMGGIGTTEQKIKGDPDLVQRMARVSVKGLRYMKQNRVGTLPVIMKSLNLDEKMAGQVYEVAAKYFTDDGISTGETLRAMVKEQVDILKLKEEIPAEKLFDLIYAKAANQQLDAAGWKPK